MFSETGFYYLEDKEIFIQMLSGKLHKWSYLDGWNLLTDEENNKVVLYKSIVKHE